MLNIVEHAEYMYLNQSLKYIFTLTIIPKGCEDINILH